MDTRRDLLEGALFLPAAAAEQWRYLGLGLNNSRSSRRAPQIVVTFLSCCCSAAAAPPCCSCRPCRCCFELDASTVDRRLVVVSACTLVAALLLLLLLLLLMADGQSSHLLLGERKEAAQCQAAPATTRGLPSVERHELRAESEHRDVRK
jgi:hypothetical protein